MAQMWDVLDLSVERTASGNLVRVLIGNAAPEFWLPDEFLNGIRPVNEMHWVHPEGWMEIEFLPDREVEVVRFFGENRDVTYVLTGEYDHQRNAWLARWPD